MFGSDESGHRSAIGHRRNHDVTKAVGAILGPSAWRGYEASNYTRSCGMRIGRYFAAMRGSNHEGFVHSRRRRSRPCHLRVQGARRQILHTRRRNPRCRVRDGQGLQKVRRRSSGPICTSRRKASAWGPHLPDALDGLQPVGRHHRRPPIAGGHGPTVDEGGTPKVHGCRLGTEPRSGSGPDPDGTRSLQSTWRH